jgi:hypothetical protein
MSRANARNTIGTSTISWMRVQPAKSANPSASQGIEPPGCRSAATVAIKEAVASGKASVSLSNPPDTTIQVPASVNRAGSNATLPGSIRRATSHTGTAARQHTTALATLATWYASTPDETSQAGTRK